MTGLGRVVGAEAVRGEAQPHVPGRPGRSCRTVPTDPKEAPVFC